MYQMFSVHTTSEKYKNATPAILDLSLTKTRAGKSRNYRNVLVFELWEQGWRSGESARLPPMCPGFDSRTRRHMWVEFVVGSLLCSERFFSGYSGFPLSSKTNTSKFQFDLETVDEEPPRGNATAKFLLLLLVLLLLKASFSKCFPSTIKRKASVFKFLQIQ